MTDERSFIDRAGAVVSGKSHLTETWGRFFELFPEYCNTFTRDESNANLVILNGFATWKNGETPDHAIWTATIEDSLVAEWRIYEDTQENNEKFSLSE